MLHFASECTAPQEGALCRQKEIVVTSRMREAGALAFEESVGASSLEEAVEAVYIAMATEDARQIDPIQREMELAHARNRYL